MPRLLDKRVIARDLADVSTRSYDGVQPGWTLKVSEDSNSLVLGPPATVDYVLLSRDTERSQEGLSVQNTLCSTWHDISPSAGSTFRSVTGVAYGRGRFVAVGFDASNNPVIKYSSIGPAGTLEPWVDATSGFGTGIRIYGVKYFAGRFIAYGQDGNWATSIDGETWTLKTALTLLVPDGVRKPQLYSLAYGPNKGYVMVGQTNTLNTLGPGVAYFSSDGETWTEMAAGPLGRGSVQPNTSVLIPAPALEPNQPYPMYGVVYGNDKFVVVGGEVTTPTSFAIANNTETYDTYANHIAYSASGVDGTWTVAVSTQSASSHYVAEYGNGRWVISSNDGGTRVGTPYNTVLQQSTNGIDWVPATMSPVDLNNIQGIVYGNGLFVAVGPTIYKSVDGITWYQVVGPAGWPGTGTGVLGGTPGAYGNGLFVFGSRAGKIIRSSYITEVSTGAQGPTGPAGAQGPSGTATIPTDFGAVGTYVMAKWSPSEPGNTATITVKNPGDEILGSDLRYYTSALSGLPGPIPVGYQAPSADNWFNVTTSSLPGNWRYVGVGAMYQAYLEFQFDDGNGNITLDPAQNKWETVNDINLFVRIS